MSERHDAHPPARPPTALTNHGGRQSASFEDVSQGSRYAIEVPNLEADFKSR